MTILEDFKNKNIDELVDWFDKHFTFDDAPWWIWWDKNYCSKCISEMFIDDNGDKTNFAYCEVNGNCKFFKELDDIPDNKSIIKMWLESELKNETCI